jgi:hypothetical protein
MSAEAIIGSIALFIACIPGIRFILRRHNKFRQLWNRASGAALPLSGTQDLSLQRQMPQPSSLCICGIARVLQFHTVQGF